MAEYGRDRHDPAEGETMRLSPIEFWAMNNPIRRLIQQRLEFGLMRRFLRERGIDLSGSVILDAGCGSGFSTHLIQDAFNPRELRGFDLMPEQIARARRRYPHLRFAIGDITRIDQPDSHDDAVFVFGILHHVPGWRSAVGETYRVLKPGGVLLVEEIAGSAVDFFDRFFGTVHAREARFDWPMFRAALESSGYLIEREATIVMPWFRSFLARKPPAV